MNVDQIKLFIAVYKARSFANVAKEMNVAPSSVSRAIASLEAQLQARLFQRTTRSLAPTQIGEQYFNRIEPLVDEIELVQQDVFSQNSEPFGTLRVSASTSFGQVVIAPLLKGFYERYPKINLELVLADTKANMIEEQFDLALRHGRLSDSNLIARKLMDVRYKLVAHTDYLSQRENIRSPKDISQHDLISFGFSEFEKVWNFRQEELHTAVSIDPMLTVTSAAAIKACVHHGMGVALLPDWIVAEDIKQQRLIHVLPDWHVAGANFDTGIWFVYPSRSFVPAKTRAFIDFLETHI